jgi:hypothetical protein
MALGLAAFLLMYSTELVVREDQRMDDLAVIIPSANREIIEASGVDGLLGKIRPQWKTKNLIRRVARILPVDPSSACQRIFNAAIHDLKEKIVVAGLDIAGEAAKQHKLPKIDRTEDVETLSVSRTIELCYRMGLLSRPEWRRILRVYDIRKDLEHEDDEYEAGVEDCVYVFKTCIEVVLSRDPIQVIKLTDVKQIVEQPVPSTLGEAVVTDYKSAPNPRQLEIYRFLISSALSTKHPDIIRQNCYNALGILRAYTAKQVILDSASSFQDRISRSSPSIGEARVAAAAGIFPYLKKTNIKEFFSAFYDEMEKAGYGFRSHQKHGELLRNLKELGGLDFCHDEIVPKIVKWLLLCYIGEPSFGQYSRSRHVFYSNIGAPLSFRILCDTYKDLYDIISEVRKEDRDVKRACSASEYVERRLQEILDALEK